jgi:hypothetical protein
MSNVIHTMPNRRYVDRQISETQRLYAARFQPTTLQRLSEVIRIGTSWLVVLLALRGIMTFLAASQSNRLVSVLHFATAPFVAPFKAMFNYDTSVFEVYTAVAMMVFAILGWSAVQILNFIHSSNVDTYWERG